LSYRANQHGHIVLEERAGAPSGDAADDLSHEEPERQALIAVAACPRVILRTLVTRSLTLEVP